MPKVYTGRVFSALPAVGVRLLQTDVCQDTAGKLVSHLIERCRKEVVGRDEWKDSRSRIGSPVHVAKMNFIERRFANAEHQRTFFLEANVGGALDQLRCDSVRHASEGPNATRQHD